MISKYLATTIGLILTAASHAAEITSVPLRDPCQGAIIINGDIAYGDQETFLTKIAPFSSGLVILNSRGGAAYAGIAIGKAIRMRGFTTWVPSGSYCASACAVAWLGGVKRLMGKDALIGFHSVYQMENGKAVEIGSGNALYGAYLAELGLSERAIMYLSNAAPDSMQWLTPAQAENFGIALTVFDPKQTEAAAAPSVAPAQSIEQRARDFIIALHVLTSGPSDKLLRILNGIYADEVLYYGKQTPQADVVTQIGKFLDRWPVRSYTVQPASLKVVCSINSECRAIGLVNFDARSPARQQWSHGVASFDYLLIFRPNLKWPLIVSESGKVVTRNLDPLSDAVPANQPSAALPLALSPQ